jgi:acetyl esterase/lipase
MSRPVLVAAILGCATAAPARPADPPVVYLWEKGAPGFEDRKDEKEVRDRVSKETGEYRLTNVHNPYVTVFLPPKEKATGAAVVIVPGGGHRELWPKHEGENVAEWLKDRGVAAVVLRYRLAREKGSPYKIDVHALQDGQRAIRLVRGRAAEWGVDPGRVGMLGFSAGGEVVGMVCSRADPGSADAPDPVDRLSARPNFQGLVYSGPLGVRGQAVTKDTPPAFVVVGDTDGAATWLLDYVAALRKAKVTAEMHVYAKAPHGFGYRPSRITRPADRWPERFEEFLGVQEMLKRD